MIDILKQFNWLDILLLVFFVRICVIASQKGLSVEIFKVLGTFFCIYLSFHYYSLFANAVYSLPFFKFMSFDLVDFACFLILVFAGYFVFILLRRLFGMLFKMEDTPGLFNKWTGFALGIIRGVLCCSLLVYILFISGSGYLQQSTRNSMFAKPIFNIAAETYHGIWNGLMSKMMPLEKINKSVFAVEESYRTHK